MTCLRIPSYLNIMKFLRIFRIPSYLNIMKCCAVNSKIINIMKFYYDTMVIWSRVIHVSDITTNKKQKQNYAWTFMLKAWDSNHHNWLSTFLYFFEIFLRTHSMPSLTPSPLVAEHAWICHTRSWQSFQRFSHRCCHCYSVLTGAHLDFYLFFYLYLMQAETLCNLGRGGGSYEVLLVGIHEDGDTHQLLLAQQLLRTHQQ